MARRSRMSQQKRQRELRKAEKAANKRAKRHGLVEPASEEVDDGEPVSSTGPAAAPAPNAMFESTPEPATSAIEEPLMTQETPEEKVDAYCKVCKLLTPHSVLERTKTTKKPKRVQCQSCQDSHPFRAKPPSKKKKTIIPKAEPTGSYDSLMAGRDLSLSVKYDMSHEFVESDLLDHASFGVGVVVRVLLDRKIEVRFPDTTKMLAHARP